MHINICNYDAWINIIISILIVILNVTFNAAYYSYFLIISSLFMGYDLYYRWGKNGTISFHFSNQVRLLFLGNFLFYGSLFISSLVLRDISSLSRSLWLLSLTIPMYVLYYFSSSYNVTGGFQTGVIVSVALNLLCGFLQMAGVYQKNIFDVNRMQGFWGHPNSMGLFMAFMAPVLLFMGVKAKGIYIKCVYFLLLLMSVICLGLSQSRGAVVSLLSGGVVGLLFLIYIERKKISTKRLIVSIVAILSALVVTFSFYVSISSNRGPGERKVMWEASIEMWEDHKMLGVGMSRWKENYYSPKYHPTGASEKNLNMPHNMALYFLSGAGIIGGVSYILLSLIIFVVVFHCSAVLREIYGVLPLVIYTIFFIEGLFDSTISDKQVALPFFAFVGFFVGTLDLKNTKTWIKMKRGK